MEELSLSYIFCFLSGILLFWFFYLLRFLYNKKLEKDRLYNVSVPDAYYLSDIINSVSSVIIAVNKDWIIKEWNIDSEKLSGNKKSSVLGHSLKNIYPKLFFAVNNHLKNLKEEFFHGTSFKFVEKNGSVQYSVSLFPLFSSSGDILIKIDDISEIVLRENQMQHAQKMEMIGTLSTGIAHEFNNVIGGIAGIVSLMKMDSSSCQCNNMKLEKHIQNLEGATFRASKIASQLLSFSKKDNLNSVKFYKFDLNTAIKNIVRISKNSIDKSVNIISSFCSENAFINGSQGEIEQVFLNLAINAFHSMTIMRSETDSWGGELSVSTKLYEKYSYENLPLDDYWCVEFADTGVGMDDYLIKLIFTPFFTTKSKDVGTGLGLSVSYNIVKRHCGFINVKSTPGKGSVFSVFLPVFRENSENSTGSSFDKILLDNAVLVVDDEPVILEVASEMLSKVGCFVFTASDGYKAVDILRKNIEKINIVLLDLTMPLISGKETFLKLKEIKESLKVLLVSGYSFDPRVDETMKMGADMFLQKPYTFKELITAVKKLSK